MTKKKICILVSSLVNEGPVNVIYNTLANLDYSKVDVTLVTVIAERANSRLAEFTLLPIRIVQINPNNKLGLFQLLSKFKETLVNLNPDLLHSHCVRTLFFLQILPKSLKKAYTIHIYPGIQQKVLYGNIVGQVVIWLSKYFIKRLDIPIACANNVRDEFLTNDNFSVLAIPNGSKDVFKRLELTPSSINKNRLKRELNLDINKRHFIFIGRFSKEKNPDFLVKAFSKLRDQDIELIMLGDGPLIDSCKAISSENVKFTGFVTDVYKYIFASDYYVSSSSTEGLANTLLETMSAGLPFLLTEIPPHLEVINSSPSKMGYSFQTNNFEDFSNKLSSLLDSNYSEMSMSVTNCFKENYTDEIMAKKYLDVYCS